MHCREEETLKLLAKFQNKLKHAPEVPSEVAENVDDEGADHSWYVYWYVSNAVTMFDQDGPCADGCGESYTKGILCTVV
jgi:hypothetical protein